MARYLDLNPGLFTVPDTQLQDCGFLRVQRDAGSNFATFWRHPKAPGLLFKRVTDANSAVAWGGICAASADFLYLRADQVTKRLQEQIWGQKQSWIAKFNKGSVRYHRAGDNVCDYNPSIEVVPGAVTSDPILACLAIVTPCSMVGVVGTGRDGAATRHQISYEAGPGVNLSIAAGSGHSISEGRRGYILQWRIMPFANNCQLRLKTLLQSIANGYPSDAQEDMAEKLGDEVANIYTGKAPLNLFHLTITDNTNATPADGYISQTFGFIPRNAARRPDKVGNLYGFNAQAEVTKTDVNFNFTVPGFELPISREIDGVRRFIDLIDPVLSVGMPVSSMKNIDVMGYTADTAKLFRDFHPLIDRQDFADGTTVFAVEAQKIDPGIDAQDPNTNYGVSNGEATVPEQDLAAWPAGPDAFVELYNWAVRAEMKVAKSKANARPDQAIFSNTGADDKPYPPPAPAPAPAPATT